MLKKNIEKTFELLDNSYCPYSKFRVASSVITKENKLYGGINVENSSYGLTMCAERTALYNTITNGIKKEDIDYIIIASDCTINLLPCGACLQVLSEFINKNTKIIIACCDKQINKNIIKKEYIFKDLLPNAFNL